MEDTFSGVAPQAQEILMFSDGQFHVEPITPTPAAGEPCQTLREALEGIRIVATGNGGATTYDARGPRFRVFDPGP